MEVKLNSGEQFRLENSFDSSFIDASNTDGAGLSVNFYPNNSKLILIKKENFVKMFVLPEDFGFDFDFGLWKNGEVLWKSY